MKGRYFYKRFIGHYNVYKRDDNENENITTGTKICDFQDEEEARKEVYRLNGWKYKPKKQNQDE